MINPVSSSTNVYLQQTQSSKPQQISTPRPSQAEDSVKLSPQAQAALSGGDADHDGDGR
jgi:hypothetical protein